MCYKENCSIETKNLELKNKKKRAKPEEFIGKTFNSGKLKVTGIVGKRGACTLYSVICEVCSQDPELFPKGYFVSTKSDLVSGQIPCGCSKRVKWDPDQWIIRAKRVGEVKGFIVSGYAEEFKGCITKVHCECTHDGCKWLPRLDNIVNNGHGCPECHRISLKEKMLLPEAEVIEKCQKACAVSGYEFQGFLEGNYIGAVKTTVLYKCPIHGNKQTNYHSFINAGHRCMECWKERQREVCTGLYGLYLDRLEDQDFLYVLSFNGGEFIKVGRTFDLKYRISKLESKQEFGNKNIKLLQLFTGKHHEIWKFEQELHDKLKASDFQFFHDNWNSIELFKYESLPMLNKLLDVCSLEEIH